MSRFVIIDGCKCHKGNMYRLDNEGRISKIVYECNSPNGLSIGFFLSPEDYKYKEVINIQTIISAVLSNLT